MKLGGDGCFGGGRDVFVDRLYRVLIFRLLLGDHSIEIDDSGDAIRASFRRDRVFRRRRYASSWRVLSAGVGRRYGAGITSGAVLSGGVDREDVMAKG